MSLKHGYKVRVNVVLLLCTNTEWKRSWPVDRESHSQFGGSLRLVQNIVRNEKIISALYRGLTPNLVGNSLSWALYFVWYDRIKYGIGSYRGSGSSSLSYYDFFIASGTAGTMCS